MGDALEEMFMETYRLPAQLRGGSIDAKWSPDGAWFAYTKGLGDARSVQRVDAKSGEETVLVDLKRLWSALSTWLGYKPSKPTVPFDAFQLSDTGLSFSAGGRDFTLDLDTYELKTPFMPPSPEQRAMSVPRMVRKRPCDGIPDVYEVPSTDGKWLLGASGPNLILRSTVDGREVPLTDDGEEDDFYDVSGASWSPSGNLVAAHRVNQRGVHRVPVVHWLKREEDVEWQVLSKTGGRAATQTPLLFDVRSREVTELRFSRPVDGHTGYVGWRPDGSELLVMTTNRGGNRVALVAVDPTTGEGRELIVEQSPTFISNGVASAMYTPLESGNGFLWISERDGWAHVYRYDRDGNEVAQVTSGEFPVLGVLSVDEENDAVYVLAQAEPRIYDAHVYRVTLSGEGFQRLTEDEGQHLAAFSPDNGAFLDTHSSHDRPPRVDLRRSDGSLVRTVSSAALDEWNAVGWRPAEEFTVLAADGRTELHGALFKPWDFDESRSYPLIDHIYGGPQTTWVPRSLDGPGVGFAQAMARCGFAVMTLDARGTPRRSKAFQDAIHQRFGAAVVEDHAAAVKQMLERHSWMDPERVGVSGGSWGGYMTIRCMLDAPDVFKVGMSFAPVVDAEDHQHQIESYMGTPADNPEGYLDTSNIAKAAQLQGRLMLVHGTNDVNATFSATMKMADALIRADKQFDMLVLPGVSHHPQGLYMEYYLKAHLRYFREHLLN